MVISTILHFIFCMLNTSLYQQDSININVNGCLGIFLLEQLMFYFAVACFVKINGYSTFNASPCKQFPWKVKKSAPL